MKQSKDKGRSNSSEASDQDNAMLKLPLSMGMENGIVVECDDEHLESPMPLSAQQNRRDVKMNASPMGLITCENVDTESPLKLLRLKKQVLSPLSNVAEEQKKSESSGQPPSNGPSRNAQHDLIGKLKQIGGTQENKSISSQQSKRIMNAASKRVSQSMRASPRDLTPQQTLKKKKTGTYKSMLDTSNEILNQSRRSNLSKGKNRTSSEVGQVKESDEKENNQQKAAERIENFCKSSYSSQTVSGNVQIRDDENDENDEQLIMESDSEGGPQDDEMSGPLELEAISEKHQQLESTQRKKKKNIIVQNSAPSKNEDKDDELEVTVQDVPRTELGGEVCYDSMAELTGCSKIVKYFEDTKDLPERRTDPYILFGQDEIKESLRETGVAEKAKERDFNNDQERMTFRNLPRFQTQRNYKHFKYQQFVQDQKNVLIFDSRFENGNLRKACKVSNIEYNLWLENDSNTKGHTQWYYFKVTYKDIASRAEKKTHKIKFNIMNLAKTSSLYQIGMKPVIYSQNKKQQEGIGWFRGGDDISYKQNNLPRSYQVYSGESKEVNQTARRIDSQFFQSNTFLQNKNGAGEGTDYYFTLSFTYEFEANKDDTVWFSHAIPATFTDINTTLKNYRFDEKYESIFRAELLCLSLGRLPVPLITITDNVKSYMSYADEMRVQQQMPGIVKRSLRQKYRGVVKLLKQAQQMRGKSTDLLRSAVEEEITQFYQYNEDQLLNANLSFAGFGQRLLSYVRDHSLKKAIVITSRVHPGEPQASHMLTGLLRYLTSPEAAALRQHFVFRIVPMLNPDGVVYGNYRCSLLGCDLNRKWDKANRLLHPTIFYTKSILRNFASERKILMFVDLHGHSRKQNAFFYGCMFRNYEHDGRVKNAQLRIIPLMCCQKNELFQLKGCNFNMNKSKEATARMTVFREFSVMLSYTVECSFFGKIAKDGKLHHMQLEDYESLGETIMKALHHYLPSQIPKLQFFTGKVLKVFHDQFIKLVPEHIIKREMDRMKQAEEEKAMKDKQKKDAMKRRQKSFVQQGLNKKLTKMDVTNDDNQQDQDTINKKLLEGVLQHKKDLNNSLINSEMDRVGEDGESPMIFDDDEDNEHLNAILQHYQLNLNAVLSMADSDTSPMNMNNEFNYVRPSGGSTSEEKVDFSSNQGGFNNQKEEWNDFEAFIQKIQDKKDKIEGESGDDSSSSADEPAIETKKKLKKKKTKFTMPRKKESETSILAPVLAGKSVSKQPESNAKLKGTHLRSKTLALQQKIPSFSRKNNNSNFQGAINSQNFPTNSKDKPNLPLGVQGAASGNLALANQTHSNASHVQPLTNQLSISGNPPPSPSVLSSIISPRRATGLADGALAMPILRKKRMRQGTMGQLSTQAQPNQAGLNSAEATPTDSISNPTINDQTQMSHMATEDRGHDQAVRKLEQVQQSLQLQNRQTPHMQQPHTPPLPKKHHSRTQSTRIASSFMDPQVSLGFNYQSNIIPVAEQKVKDESNTPNFHNQNNSADKKLNYAAALLQSQQLNKQTLNLIQNLSNIQKQKLNSIMQQRKQKPVSDVDQATMNNLKVVQEQQSQKKIEKEQYRTNSVGMEQQYMKESARDTQLTNLMNPIQTPDRQMNMTEARKIEPTESGQVSLKGSVKELMVSPSFALPQISNNSKGNLKIDSASKLANSFDSKQESKARVHEHNTDYKVVQARTRIDLQSNHRSLELSSSNSDVEIKREVSFQTEKKHRPVRNQHAIMSQQPTPLQQFEQKVDQLNVPSSGKIFNVQLSNEKTILKADQVNFNPHGSLSVGKKMQRAIPSARLEGALQNRHIVFTSPSIENKLCFDESTDLFQKQLAFQGQTQINLLNSNQDEQQNIQNALALGNVTDYLNTQLNFNNHADQLRDKSHDDVRMMSPAIPQSNKKHLGDFNKPSSSNQKSRQFLSNARRNMFLTEQTDDSLPNDSMSLKQVNQRVKTRQLHQVNENATERAFISGPVSRLNQQPEFSQSTKHYRHMSISNMAEIEQQGGQKLQPEMAPKKKESVDHIKTRMAQKQFHNSVIMQLVKDGQFQTVNKSNYMIRSPDMSNSGNKQMIQQKRDMIGISYGSQEINQMKTTSQFPDLNNTQGEMLSKHMRINSMQNQNQLGLQNYKQQLRLDSNQMQQIQIETDLNEQAANYASHMLQDKMKQKRLIDTGMLSASSAQQSSNNFVHQARSLNRQQQEEQLPLVPSTGTSKLSAKQWRHSHSSVPDSQQIQAMQQAQMYAQRIQSNNNNRKIFDSPNTHVRSENNTIYAHVTTNQQVPFSQTKPAGFFGQDHQPSLIRPHNYDSLQKGSKGLRTHEMKRGLKVQELQNEMMQNQTLSGRRSPDLLQTNQFQNPMISSGEKSVTRQMLQEFCVQPSEYLSAEDHSQMNQMQLQQDVNMDGAVQMIQRRAGKKNIGQNKRRQIMQEQLTSEMIQRQRELQIQLTEHTALLKSLHQQLSASKRQGYDAM